MNVNRGKRIAIDIDGYAGPAGFTEADGKASLAFPAASLRLRAGDPLAADGRDWIVEKVGPSGFLRGFKLVELRPAEGA